MYDIGEFFMLCVLPVVVTVLCLLLIVSGSQIFLCDTERTLNGTKSALYRKCIWDDKYELIFQEP